MADTTLRTIIMGDSSSLESSMARSAAITDATAAEMDSKFDTATSHVGGYMSRIGQAAENAGIPFGSAIAGMGEKLDEAKAKGDGFRESMSMLGGATLAVGAVGIAAVAGESVNLANKFSQTTATIAANADISGQAAQKIGNAFLGTAGTVIYSAQEQETAYAAVAAQLGSVEGHALSAKQATTVMAAAMDLAEGSGTSLTTATSSLAKVMQTYHDKVTQAAAVSDTLFNASRLTGSSITKMAGTVAKLHSRLGEMAPTLGQLSGLMVDLKNHGETGRMALSAVSSAMTHMVAPAKALITAQGQLVTATDSLTGKLRTLANQYLAGTITTTQLHTATKTLTVAQSQAWSAFTSSASAVQKAKTSYSQLGIEVVDSNGKFVGLNSVITQLSTALKGMTSPTQKAAAVQAVFGTSSTKLIQTIEAGPAAFAKYTAEVNKTGSAHEAAEKQSKTLQHQMELLHSTLDDYAVDIGDFLIPKIQDVIHYSEETVNWFDRNRVAGEALAGVIGGVLAAAVGVYTINLGTKAVNATKQAITSVSKLTTLFKGNAKASLDLSAEISAQNASMEKSTTHFTEVAAQSRLAAQAEKIFATTAALAAETAAASEGAISALEVAYDNLALAVQEAAQEVMASSASMAAEAESSMAGMEGQAGTTSAAMAGMGDAGVAAAGEEGVGALGGLSGILGPAGLIAGGALVVGGLVTSMFHLGQSGPTAAEQTAKALTQLNKQLAQMGQQATSPAQILVELDNIQKKVDAVVASMKATTPASTAYVTSSSKLAVLLTTAVQAKAGLTAMRVNTDMLSHALGISASQVTALAGQLKISLRQSLDPSSIVAMETALNRSGVAWNSGGAAASGWATAVSKASHSASTYTQQANQSILNSFHITGPQLASIMATAFTTVPRKDLNALKSLMATTGAASVKAAHDGMALQLPSISSLYDGLNLTAKTKLGKLKTSAHQAGTDAGHALTGGFGLGALGLPGTLDGIASQSVSALTKHHQDFVNAGVTLVGGITAGIGQGSGFLSTALSGAVTSAVKAAKAAATIHSPSGLTRRELGQPLGQGAALGVLDAMSLMQGSMAALVMSGTLGQNGGRIASASAIGSSAAAALSAGSGGASGSAGAFATTTVEVNVNLDGQQIAQSISIPLRTLWLQQKRAVVNIGLT